MSETKISTKAVQDLMATGRIDERRSGWRRLPESVRWGLEALLVAVVIGAGFHFGSQWLTNRDQRKADDTILQDGTTVPGEAGMTNLPEDKLADLDVEEGAGDESADPIEGGPAPTGAPEQPLASSQPDLAVGILVPKNYEVPKRPLVLALVEAKDPDIESVSVSPVTPSAQVSAPQGSGYVIRMAMSLRSVDTATPTLVRKIEELGGEKAGEVQLGWKRTGGSYFHFTMPEDKYDTLMTLLRSFAQVRYSKDPHKRVMPPGVIRIILWVEELDSVKATPAPEPTVKPRPQETSEVNPTPEDNAETSDQEIETPAEPAPQTDESTAEEE